MIRPARRVPSSEFGAIGLDAGDCAPAPSHTTGRAVCSHPAVGPSRVLPSRRRRPMTSEHSAGLSVFCGWPGVRQSRVVTVVVAPCCFVLCFVIVSSPSIDSLSSFGPSLETPFLSCVPPTLLWPLLTSPRLSARRSPRVRVGSFRSRLTALQHALSDCWASRVLACSPRTSCLTAHLYYHPSESSTVARICRGAAKSFGRKQAGE